MCNSAPVDVAPAVQTQVLGNNSSAYAETENLKDSVQTHLTLNIAGGTFVCVILIVAIVIIFLVHRAQKIGFQTVHQRLHHLSKFVEFPEKQDDQTAESNLK